MYKYQASILWARSRAQNWGCNREEKNQWCPLGSWSPVCVFWTIFRWATKSCTCFHLNSTYWLLPLAGAWRLRVEKRYHFRPEVVYSTSSAGNRQTRTELQRNEMQSFLRWGWECRRLHSSHAQTKGKGTMLWCEQMGHRDTRGRSSARQVADRPGIGAEVRRWRIPTNLYQNLWPMQWRAIEKWWMEED